MGTRTMKYNSARFPGRIFFIIINTYIIASLSCTDLYHKTGVDGR